MSASRFTGPPFCLACVDVTGGDRALDVVAVTPSGQVIHKRCEVVDDVVLWVTEWNPQVVAIDCPSGGNQRLARDPGLRKAHGWKGTKFWNFRVAEAILSSRGIGLYHTPPNDEGRIDSWIATGQSLFAALIKAGYTTWAAPGAAHPDLTRRRLIEIHPHACFVIGLGFVPPSKESMPGSLVRIAHVVCEARDLGWTLAGDAWPGTQWLRHLSETALAVADGTSDHPEEVLDRVRPLMPIGHDVIDCLGGIVTAARFASGQAYAVGHQDEGVIVVPGPLPANRYPTLAEKLTMLSGKTTAEVVAARGQG